jgi:hypothetical protein
MFRILRCSRHLDQQLQVTPLVLYSCRMIPSFPCIASEPMAVTSESLTVHVGLTDTLPANQNPLTSNVTLPETSSDPQQINEIKPLRKKHRKRTRKHTQPKQGSAIEQSPDTSEGIVCSHISTLRSQRSPFHLPDFEHDLSTN